MRFQKLVKRLEPLLSRLKFWQKPEPAPVNKIKAKRTSRIAPEKQEELEKLCAQLFKQKELITSGKLQFLGLSKVKRRLGKSWEGVRQIVFNTVEDIIDRHMGKGDIFIRYRDDTYIIIFAHASLEEGKLKSALIAEEIRKELFALEEKELRDIEIRKALAEVRTSMMHGMDFPDFLDALDVELTEADEKEKEEEYSGIIDEPPDIESIEVDSKAYRPKAGSLPTAEDAALPEDIKFTYMPIWDIRRSVLTTYLALPFTEDQNQGGVFDKYKSLYTGLSSATQKAALERYILEHIMKDLEEMAQEGRQFILACPVQHETLYQFEDYERYKQLLLNIPEQQRPYLVFYVMNFDKPLPVKHAYWFAKPLRQFCRHVYAEIPLRRDINFNYLRNTGVDVAGVRLDGVSADKEQDVFNLLSSFASKAKALKVPMTFAMQVSSVSFATSAVCAKFDFLSGEAVHKAIEHPEAVQRYGQNDLLAGILNTEP